MRVLHVVQELGHGGAQSVILSINSRLAERGHMHAVAAAPGNWSDAFDGPLFPLPLIQRRPVRFLVAARSLRIAIAQFQPDIVHCHNPLMAVTARAAMPRRRIPTVVTVHGVPEDRYLSTARLLKASGTSVIGCGPGVTAALLENGCPVLTTIDNGVPPEPKPFDRRALLAGVNLPSDAAFVVSVGRLAQVKRHDRVLRAMARLPGVSCAIVGEGPLGPSLQNYAEELGIAERVAFTGMRNDARQIIGAADVLISTSDSEGLSLVLLEAMMAQTPIVATSVRGTRELLTHETDAYLVDASDEDGVVRAVRRLLDDPNEAARLASAARQHGTRYTSDSMTSRYLDLYEEQLR